MFWEHLLEESDLARLLPESEQRFAAPIRETLLLFLSRLPESRQAEVLERQMQLPADAALAVRLSRLAAACPVLHKLGQVIARDRRIEPELREQLSTLESLPPTTSMEEIQRTLQQELGPLDELGLQLAPAALAEASVAVVVPFSNAAGTIDGVFKVLKPGIEQRLEEELALLSEVGAFLDEKCHAMGIPELDYQDAFAQVRDKLACELRLDKEQQHLREAQAFYADDPNVVIPAVYEYCTPRVTAMQRIEGCKVTDQAHVSPREVQKLARLVAKSLIAAPVFSPSPSAPFHSDPHAGNLFVTPEGRLAILDWSLVGVLREDERRAIAQVLLGGVMLDHTKVLRAIQRLATRPADDPSALEAVVKRSVDRLVRFELPSMAWLVDLLDESSLVGELRVSGDLMLFRKSLLTLSGVLNDLGDAGRYQNQVILCEFLKSFAIELPLRWIHLPHSRDYRTRLSNIDLSSAASVLPWTVSRRLAAVAFDHLQHWMAPEHNVANAAAAAE